jgi:hypothetical protein
MYGQNERRKKILMHSRIININSYTVFFCCSQELADQSTNKFVIYLQGQQAGVAVDLHTERNGQFFRILFTRPSDSVLFI